MTIVLWFNMASPFNSTSKNCVKVQDIILGSGVEPSAGGAVFGSNVWRCKIALSHHEEIFEGKFKYGKFFKATFRPMKEFNLNFFFWLS